MPHEFAHYWLNNMWNYVRSGAASEKYQNRWGIVADWLGIKPTQTRIYRAQQEQFARGYEAYLWRGELPNPIIKGAFDDYDKWLREVYKDIKYNFTGGFIHFLLSGNSLFLHYFIKYPAKYSGENENNACQMQYFCVNG